MPREDGAEPVEDPDPSGRGSPIILLYVRPPFDGVTELDRRVGTIAERYAAWLELVVMRPEELAGTVLLREPTALVPSSPALLLLRGGDVVGEAMGALLPWHELDLVVRCAVEWPAPH